VKVGGNRQIISHHIERDTPLTITSPLGGEDEGEGEGNTKTALAYGKGKIIAPHIESKTKGECGVKSAR